MALLGFVFKIKHMKLMIKYTRSKFENSSSPSSCNLTLHVHGLFKSDSQYGNFFGNDDFFGVL